MGNHSSGVGVLDKAVAILDASVSGASLADLVSQTGLPRATAHRLAQALETHGLLQRDPVGQWRPGPRLSQYAGATPDLLISMAQPVLEELRDTTGESAQLYLRRNQGRVCVAVAERASGLRDTVPLGSVLPLTAGSGAHVLLAWEPPALTGEALIRAKFSARSLAEVRRNGWASSVAERESGVASVSAPVWGGNNRVVAAVGISGPIARLGRRPGEKFAPAILRAGAALSHLGVTDSQTQH
jgi:DNA-binding IclR family transcriptional regulator